MLACTRVCITARLGKLVQRWDAKSGNTPCQTPSSLSANLTARSPQYGLGGPPKGKRKDIGGTPGLSTTCGRLPIAYATLRLSAAPDAWRWGSSRQGGTSSG